MLKAYRKTLITNDMKKVFCIFLSLIALMGLSACEPETPDNPQKPNPEESSYLTFVSSGESSVALVKVGEPSDISLEYSIDGKSWNPYTIGEAIYLFDEDKLSFRAGETGNEGFSKGKDDYYQFKISGEIAARGNTMSLLDRNCARNNVPANAFASLFRDCQSLTSAPDLPAAVLAKGCYAWMFYDCTSLTKAPALPAMNLAESCYYSMFESCTSLNETPTLSATELSSGCYFGMFAGCTSLTEAPALPATELFEGCYSRMFYGCTSLTKAPELPATELASFCYSGMFDGCTSLIETLDLPATKLTAHCYSGMFYGCTSLIKAPELPATELTEYCYSEMFCDCTNLNHVKALFTDEPSESTTSDWLYGVAPTGTFVKSKNATWDVRGASGIPVGWTVETDAGTSDDPPKPNPEESSYLTFVSTGESTISLIKNGNPDPITLEYSTNGSTWTTYTIGGTITISNGENLMFRAGKTGNEGFSKGKDNYYQFEISGEVFAKGNIMSLLDRTCRKNDIPSYAFYSLFRDCKGLTEAPELPATELTESCYAWMFSGCTSLTETPTLSATELAGSCYYEMFYGCTSLTEAPELPAMELAESCYYAMFSGCKSLMKAPALPATNLVEGCYNHMFIYCMKLNYVKALFTDEPSESTTAEWLGGVSFTGTFVKSKNAAWDVRGISGIPEGWTVITE